MNDTFYQMGNPIFLYISGEGPMAPKVVTSLQVNEYARMYGARKHFFLLAVAAAVLFCYVFARLIYLPSLYHNLLLTFLSQVRWLWRWSIASMATASRSVTCPPRTSSTQRRCCALPSLLLLFLLTVLLWCCSCDNYPYKALFCLHLCDIEVACIAFSLRVM